ncbi:hypothetical protein LIER_27637 [Lithospermum erythrorhizon]|uniref:Uncharacterized protein n=1 Tax=Lithospermum erythrorhizon TaxID=34254 RepID=A0AAV3REA1_LITER
MTKLHELVNTQGEEVKLCKEAIEGGCIAREIMTPAKIPEALKYEGKRDPKELERIFWSLKCYFNAMGIKEDKQKVDMTVLYLKENASLWWRCKHGDISKGLCDVIIGLI